MLLPPLFNALLVQRTYESSPFLQGPPLHRTFVRRDFLVKGQKGSRPVGRNPVSTIRDNNLISPTTVLFSVAPNHIYIVIILQFPPLGYRFFDYVSDGRQAWCHSSHLPPPSQAFMNRIPSFGPPFFQTLCLPTSGFVCR